MCDFYDETSTDMDVVRVIKKFDMYHCDLGDPTPERGNTLGKVRPCIIVSSDDINCIFSNQYVVVPMRTIHKNVTDDNISEFIQNERYVGRICIPIKMDGVYRVLDINQIRQIPSTKVLKYCGSIIKPELRKNINAALMELLFARYEFTNSGTSAPKRITEEPEHIKAEPVIVEAEAIKETKSSEKKHAGGRKLKFPQGFSLYYKAWAEGKMTAKEIADKTHVHYTTTYNHIRKYRELHPEIEVKIKTKLI